MTFLLCVNRRSLLWRRDNEIRNPDDRALSHTKASATMTRTPLAFILAAAIVTLMSSCDSLKAASGKYHQQENPGETIVLNDDGTCQRNNFACTWTLSGNQIKMNVQQRDVVIEGTIDGKRLTVTEPGPAGGTNTAIFVRE